MDLAPVIAVLLTLATALIAYVGVIQKEREFGRTRPLLSTRVRTGDHGAETFVIANEGGEPALGLTIRLGGTTARVDVLKVAAELVYAVPDAADHHIEVVYRGLHRPRRRSVRVYRTQAGVTTYVEGFDETLGRFNRFKTEL